MCVCVCVDGVHACYSVHAGAAGGRPAWRRGAVIGRSVHRACSSHACQVHRAGFGRKVKRGRADRAWRVSRGGASAHTYVHIRRAAGVRKRARVSACAQLWRSPESDWFEASRSRVGTEGRDIAVDNPVAAQRTRHPPISFELVRCDDSGTLPISQNSEWRRRRRRRRRRR